MKRVECLVLSDFGFITKVPCILKSVPPNWKNSNCCMMATKEKVSDFFHCLFFKNLNFYGISINLLTYRKLNHEIGTLSNKDQLYVLRFGLN